MYSYTDPQIVTCQLNSNKSKQLISKTNTVNPFVQSPFNQFNPYLSFHHSFSHSNHLNHSTSNSHPFFHPHLLQSQHINHISSNLNNYLYDQQKSHLPFNWQSNLLLLPQQQNSSSTNNYTLPSTNYSPKTTTTTSSCDDLASPTTIDSTSITAAAEEKNKSTSKVYYSNKRKEYEAREEKKLINEGSIKLPDLSKCNEIQGTSFSCPICHESGFTSNTLKGHFELELKKVKYSESTKNNNIDVESVS